MAAAAGAGRSASKARASVSPFRYDPVDIDEACSAFLAASREGEEAAVRAALERLRAAVLFQGIPPEAVEEEEEAGESRALDEGGGVLTSRGRVWKALLGVDVVDAGVYRELVARRESGKYAKIRGDSFRTFPSSPFFVRRVPEQAIVRITNSFFHRFSKHFSYVQGMNCVAAPLLFTMPEVDAFFAFSKLVCEKFPLYWINDMAGAFSGCVLVDKLLQRFDNELFLHIRDSASMQKITAKVYAFHCVSSLSSSVPPLDQLLVLWDFLFAFGFHLNVVCVAAQVMLMRQDLLASPRPYHDYLHYLKWPELRAHAVIALAVSLLPQIPAALFEQICRHGSDVAVCSKLLGRAVNFDPSQLPSFDRAQ